MGGSLPVIIPYTSEFIRNKYRGPYLGVQAFFWMIGQLTCGMLAWAIIPIRLFHLFGREIESWRICIAICALPSLIGAVMYFFLPENPWFLLQVKHVVIKSILPSLLWLVTLSHCCYQSYPCFTGLGWQTPESIKRIATDFHAESYQKIYRISGIVIG